jgi:Protein of unknown function (DUF1688)
MTEPHLESQATLAYLRSPQAIRDRCEQLFDLCLQNQLQHFRCNLDQLDPVVESVLTVIQAAYPDWQVPFHSRWRHFQAGGYDRVDQLRQKLTGVPPLEQTRIQFDLAITSVLLDAGAGSQWCYIEPATQQSWQRSEGLAIASYDWFLRGGFSSDPQQPWQADATGLQTLTVAKLATGFQVTEQNPLVGLEGRVQLMQQLGRVLAERPELFGQTTPRPGGLVDSLLQQSQNNQLSATTILAAVLEGLGEIWPGRVTLAGVNLGDVWPHSQLPSTEFGSQLVPFHKLSQWLTYSLLEPLQELGLEITDLDQLTGLAEYRNGGLCLDLGLLQPKHAAVCGQPHLPGSEVIVEWRALTVVLLDRIADRMRQVLGQSATDLPLVKILEGGTWAAGRRIAAERRPTGDPPIQVISDGTVF